MAGSSAAADPAAAARALQVQLARLRREPPTVRWVTPGEIQVRAAEAAALQTIVSAGQAVGTAADWAARTASAPAVLFGYAAIGGALLGALAGLGGGVVGGLLGTGVGAIIGSLLGCLVALACADRVGLAVDRGARTLGGGVGPGRRAVAGARVGVVLGFILGSLGGYLGGAAVGQYVYPGGESGARIGFGIGIVGGPVAGAFGGLLLGAVIGAARGGIETLSRALFLGVSAVAGLASTGRVAAGVLAAASVSAFASVLGVVFAVGLGAGPGVATDAGLGATLGSVLGAAFGAVARGRARWIALWHPSPSSTEAALWLFWPRAGEVVAAPSPALRLSEGALHCEDGPAVAWPHWVRGWYWRGVPVPRDVIESPEALSPQEIRAESRPEVRRAIIERLGGVEHFMRKVGAELAQQDDYGRLWRGAILPLDSQPIATVVEVKDTTSGAVSLLRVPPRMRTAREAVAWTFGFERASDYMLAVQA